MADKETQDSKKELPLNDERLERIVESEKKTFKGRGQEVQK